MSAEAGHEAAFRFLLSAIDPGYVSGNRRELLYDAAQGGNESIFRYLLDDEDFPHGEKSASAQHALLAAVWFGRHPICEILLSVDGVSVEINYPEGKSLLSGAVTALAKSTAVVRFLLKNGANPNVKDDHGRGPLSHATDIDYCRCYDYDQAEEIILLLLDADGVDIDSAESVVRILLDRGARVDGRDNEGQTPISYAAQLHLAEAVQKLLEKGAEVDCTDNVGRMPLSHAVDSQRKEREDWPSERLKNVVEILLAHGSNPALEDNERLTPLSRAATSLEGSETLTLLQSASDTSVKSSR
ncbi:ankyrin repeat-containing domain protein [Aspergillus aurantiobrunneus]